MEVIQLLQSLVNSDYSIFVAVAAMLTVFLKIVAHITKAMDWHDQRFVRKRLSCLKDVRSGAASARLVKYLDDAIELEMFRIASGVSTSRSKMQYLLQLDETGRWSRMQLQSLEKFLALQPGSETPVLSVTFLDRLSAWISGLSTLLTLALGVGYLTELVLTGATLMWALGLLLFGLAMLLARYLATDFIDYVIVKRAQRHLSWKAQILAPDH
ncbi:hypothetical protein [Pseudomonas sp. CFBP 13719]|uniref:hypothetical protein n=1 Tax=Pseudomonas sp. CFBP 13719 TaxID=2775303 RepID=UPI00177A9E72|nr:hypothetical protein [Pseudomonas sp. CFBP 13719]MBD8682340.1 hypothetical protein [Pseudomonas sp. CFBP 13719]